MRYVYSVVRFVPDPGRGEFVNVGAIAGSEDASEWRLRQIGNPVRARRMDNRGSLEAVWAFLDRVGHDMDAYDRSQETLFESEVELSEAWLEQLFVEHRNVVQLSPPAPLVADSAEEALERVFDQLILDPAHQPHRFQTKHAALAAVRGAYREHSVNKNVNLRERVVLETSRHRERFDFAVTNGLTLQLAQTWSFQVPDQEQLAEQVKSWGWTVQDVRLKGGRLTLADRSSFEVRPDVDLEVVYVAPAPDQQAPAMRDALHVFEALDIGHGPLNYADAVARQAHRLLLAEGVGRLDLPPRAT
jgi:hypothetical protein